MSSFLFVFVSWLSEDCGSDFSLYLDWGSSCVALGYYYHAISFAVSWKNVFSVESGLWPTSMAGCPQPPLPTCRKQLKFRLEGFNSSAPKSEHSLVRAKGFPAKRIFLGSSTEPSSSNLQGMEVKIKRQLFPDEWNPRKAPGQESVHK